MIRHPWLRPRRYRRVGDNQLTGRFADTPMYFVRDIMYCKPGKVRAMVEKFSALSKLSAKVGMPSMRIMTDLSAEQYWTVVSTREDT